MPTFGSLFSGIGGLDLGLERAGWECRWQVEIDPWCRRVLEKHWPAVPKYDDVRRLNGSDLEPVDLICGGFPCQPVASCGKQLGQADPRWLWPEFARLLGELRPRLTLMENVPNLASIGLDTVLGDLAALGFDAEWDCIPAATFGAPHLRYRLFIVAYVANPDGPRSSVRQEPLVLVQQPSPERDHWWTTEPDVVRVVHGSAGRVDRIRGLGNSVVPQVAEWIGQRLLEAFDDDD